MHGLEFKTLPMGIGRKVHGMKEQNKVLECIHLGMVNRDLATGIVVLYRFLLYNSQSGLTMSKP